MQTECFKVLAVSANPLLQSVLPALLGRRETLRCQGGVTSAAEALDRIDTDRPDIVIADMPPSSVQDILTWRTICDRGPRLIMLTRYMEEAIDTRAVLAGAAALILVPEQRLADAVQRVASGDNLRPVELEGRLRALVSGEMYSSLNGEELRVFALVSEGESDSQIAARLNTSRENVRKRIVRIAEKLG